MTAARVGEPERAIDALLLDTPKNHYGLNGHVYQRPGLTIYLPANGGLLYAVAMMAAGWDRPPLPAGMGGLIVDQTVKNKLPKKMRRVFPTTASGACAGKIWRRRPSQKW